MLLPPPGNARILTATTLVNTFGNGAYLSVSVLFLTRSVGLTPGEVALGLAVAAGAAMLLSTPMGLLADRLGPREVQRGALLVLAACYCLLATVGGVWTFTALACVIAAGEAAVKSAAGAMVARSVPPEQRLRARAYLRSANNAGIALGAAFGGLPLLLDSRAGYLAVLFVDAATCAAAALVLSRATRVPPLPTPAAQPRLVALRDRPFVAFALVDGLMQALYNAMVGLALPLWLATRGGAPLWLVSAALLVNTIGCVTLQVWAAGGVDGLAYAARIGRRGAWTVAASCLLFGVPGRLPTAVVTGLVLAAAVVHVLGELWLSTATWAVVYGLAPEWAQGQYQGAYQTGRQIGNMVSPPLLTALVVGAGAAGWAGVGAIFVVGGLAYPALVGWGLRTRSDQDTAVSLVPAR
ncbi:MFS transporter [Catellatospora sp. TT07R-123]|uniref:MFS transporter n=1 Tax=Catellatospora sp. TT07R-123 TaxID=2733863 RepID=UPI001B2373EE|nr:MFS transporter [Catellatospora sp. TT07R-123]GHJ46805.1 MFS transporter [Catellatospora sp. TT07R-123]